MCAEPPFVIESMIIPRELKTPKREPQYSVVLVIPHVHYDA